MHLQLYGKKIWVFHKPVDFRFAIDGLAGFITNNTQHNPQSGVFLFYNKAKNKVKCLSYHKNGFVLVYKRLDKVRFCFDFNKEQGVSEMSIEEFGWLFAALEWQKMRDWQELPYDKFS